MEKSSMKLILLFVVLISIAGETSNIGVEGGRINQLLPCHCSRPDCFCGIFRSCRCPEDSPFTSQAHPDPMMPPMEPPMPSR
ncbi:hypothetical protein LINGRAHAP2_LOCUS33854 [Linum grandiflorum]